MNFFDKLISAFKDNAVTTIVGLIGSVAVLLDSYGFGVSPSRKDWIIAAVLAALGLVAKDGGDKGGDPNVQ